MSDTTFFLQLPGAQLQSIKHDADDITLHFSLVNLVQEMEGTIEDSLWTQQVNLGIKGAVTDGELPDCPCEISGGDMTDNIYTYRDHAPLPINWKGGVACTFKTAGASGFSIEGESMQLEQIGHPRYIKHIKK